MLQDDNDKTEKGHKDISRVQTGLENQLSDQSKMPPGNSGQWDSPFMFKQLGNLEQKLIKWDCICSQVSFSIN